MKWIGIILLLIPATMLLFLFISSFTSITKAVLPIIIRREQNVFPALLQNIKNDAYGILSIRDIAWLIRTAVKLRITSWKKLGSSREELDNFIERVEILELARIVKPTSSDGTKLMLANKISAAIEKGIITHEEITQQ